MIFVYLSARLFQRHGSRKDIANLVALKHILGSMKLLLLYNLKRILKRYWYFIIFNSKH